MNDFIENAKRAQEQDFQSFSSEELKTMHEEDKKHFSSAEIRAASQMIVKKKQQELKLTGDATEETPVMVLNYREVKLGDENFLKNGRRC